MRGGRHGDVTAAGSPRRPGLRQPPPNAAGVLDHPEEPHVGRHDVHPVQQAGVRGWTAGSRRRRLGRRRWRGRRRQPRSCGPPVRLELPIPPHAYRHPPREPDADRRLGRAAHPCPGRIDRVIDPFGQVGITLEGSYQCLHFDLPYRGVSGVLDGDVERALRHRKVLPDTNPCPASADCARRNQSAKPTILPALPQRVCRRPS